MVELFKDDWEGHLNGGELAHLFSVWSTPPGHAARCYGCQSEAHLSVFGPDGRKEFWLSLEWGGVLAARLLQFLSHAGTKVRAIIKRQIR